MRGIEEQIQDENDLRRQSGDEQLRTELEEAKWRRKLVKAHGKDALRMFKEKSRGGGTSIDWNEVKMKLGPNWDRSLR